MLTRNKIDKEAGIEEGIIGGVEIGQDEIERRDFLGGEVEYGFEQKVLHLQWIPFAERPDKGIDFISPPDIISQVKGRSSWIADCGLGRELWTHRAEIFIVCQQHNDDPTVYVVKGWFTKEMFFERHIHYDNKQHLGDCFITTSCPYCGKGGKGERIGQPWIQDEDLEPIDTYLQEYWPEKLRELYERMKQTGNGQLLIEEDCSRMFIKGAEIG
jgi:hypothetical protein